MPDRARVAIVGTGRIAGLNASRAGAPRTHAQAIAALDSLSLAAVHDADRARADRFAGQWGGTVHDSVERLLSEARPELLVIAAPDARHFDLAMTALRSEAPPRLIVVEKPPCTERSQMAALLAATVGSETKVVVNLSRRFDALHHDVGALIARGEWGDLVMAEFTYYGGWFHNGIHAVDTLRLLLDDEFDVISSVESAPGHPHDPCRDVQLRPRSRSRARVSLRGFDEQAFQLFELELRFCDGRLRLEDFGTRVTAERVAINAIGERELQPAAIPLAQTSGGDTTPMLNLYRASAAFLSSGDDASLRSAALEAIAPTMEILFNAC